MSATHGVYRKAVPDVVESLDETIWENIGLGESVTRVSYRPGGWKTQDYIVVWRLYNGPQRQLMPPYIVISVRS